MWPFLLLIVVIVAVGGWIVLAGRMGAPEKPRDEHEDGLLP